MRRSLLRMLSAVSVVAALAACIQPADENPLSGRGGVDDIDLDDELDERIEPETGLSDDDAPSAEAVVAAALADVEAFWERSFEDLYGDVYQPVSGGFFPYGPRTELPPCGETPPHYDDIAANAFYCPTDDLIAWDDVNLVPGLYRQFGGFTLGIIFAHEFGHAIQARVDLLGLDTILTELQADCFAGAWTADVEAGNSDYFRVTLDDLDKAIAGFLTLRDGVGTSAQDPAAHGTGFDRIGAFSEGYELGLEHCATYPDLYAAGELVIVEVPFTRLDDLEREGNLPLEQLLPAAIDDLEDFWSLFFEQLTDQVWVAVDDVVTLNPANDEVVCGRERFAGDILINASFYCVPSNTIYLDAVHLIPALDEIGDYAVATELARQYAYAAQTQLGNVDGSLASNLQADCFTGVYAASGFLENRGPDQLVLSPGDLDEAVIAFLHRSDSGEAVDDGDVTVGTAFQRFDAYRSGFMDGIDTCIDMVG